MDNNENWIIPASWRVYGEYTLPKDKYPTLADAIRAVYMGKDEDTSKLPESEYIDDSFEVEFDGDEDRIRNFYNDNEPDKEVSK